MCVIQVLDSQLVKNREKCNFQFFTYAVMGLWPFACLPVQKCIVYENIEVILRRKTYIFKLYCTARISRF